MERLSISLTKAVRNIVLCINCGAEVQPPHCLYVSQLTSLNPSYIHASIGMTLTPPILV